MSSLQIQFPMSPKIDREDNEYFIGSAHGPFTVDLSNATFLFFPPIDDDPKSRGTLLIRPSNYVNRNRVKDDRPNEQSSWSDDDRDGDRDRD